MGPGENKRTWQIEAEPMRRMEEMAAVHVRVLWGGMVRRGVRGARVRRKNLRRRSPLCNDDSVEIMSHVPVTARRTQKLRRVVIQVTSTGV